MARAGASGFLAAVRTGLLSARERPSGPRRSLATGLGAGLALAGSTILVALVEGRPLAVPDASPIYLVAVVVVAIAFGTWAAILTAFASFLLYDVLFINPRLTLTVDNPLEWLNLLLFLFVGVTIGRLTALQAGRAAEAARRARESQALFRISRTLATSSSVAEALPPIVGALVEETEMERIWVSRLTGTHEIVVADSDPGGPHRPTSIHTVLARTPGDQPAHWIRAHLGPAIRPARLRRGDGEELYRIRIEAEGDAIGSLWATRPRARGLPNQEVTRLLSLAADQLGLAFRREQLTSEANAAEIARQSEVLKSALLESVSHDLRTPLASIRAAAGSLMDPAIPWSDDERRTAAQMIDVEAERLNRLVRNLLDMSRIEGGALKPDFQVFDLAELLEPVIARLRPVLPEGLVGVEIPPDLPPVRVDAVYLDEAITNLLENAAKHAPGAPTRISALLGDGAGSVRLRVEDGGPGVPPEALPHLFEKFYRVRRAGEGSRRGLGIGLSVVKGLVGAMGGEVRAGRSELGGLAIDLYLPAVPAPPAEAGAA